MVSVFYNDILRVIIIWSGMIEGRIIIIFNIEIIWVIVNEVFFIIKINFFFDVIFFISYVIYVWRNGGIRIYIG